MTNPDMPDIKKRAEKFYHPYSPYGIQLEFMTSLYETLENYKVGIFESPTGTVSSPSF
jgi:chromosome transmission fidelity protein 1